MHFSTLPAPVRKSFVLLLMLFIALCSTQAFAQQAKKPFTLDLGLGSGFIGQNDQTNTFQPELEFSFIPSHWGLGVNTGFSSLTPSFNPDQYRDGFEQFTSVQSDGDKWQSFFVGIGPRLEFGANLPVQFKAGVDLSLNYNSPPEYSVDFNDPDGNFSDVDLKLSVYRAGDDFKKWTTAIKPEFQVQFSPGRSQRFGFHVTTGVHHKLADNTFTYTERDLSEVRNVDNVRTMFRLFEQAPVVERIEQPPQTNFFVNAGVKIKFGGAKAQKINQPVFTDATPSPLEGDDPTGEDGNDENDDLGDTENEKDGDGDEGDEDNAEDEPEDGDEPEEEEEEEDQEEPEQLFVGLNGEFEVENLDINGNGPFSGTGQIFIDWLQSYVSVEFTGITVNPANNHLMTGQVTSVIDANAPAYPKAWASPVATNYVAYNHPEVAAVNNFMLQQPFYEYNGNPITPTVLEAPIGVELDPDSWFAIMEIVFESDKSKFNASIAYETPADWNNADLVGFAVKDLEFHPQSISFQQGRLEIVDDLTVGNANNDINFTFLKPVAPAPGTFIEWDDTGFTLFGIEIQSEFTRDWLLPVPDNGTDKVAATLSATGTKWNDFVLTGDLDKAEIAGGTGMTLEANTLSYDMSDFLNPAGIEFPDIYTGVDTTSLWRGFYAKNFAIGLPASIETHQSGPPEISVNDMIIDHQGITFQAFANNVYQYPNASVADLNASVDEIEVNILTNSLVDAWIKGKVAIPATHPDSLQNPLNYHGLFATGVNTPVGSSFELTIDPSGPIYTNMLRGTFTLEPTSSITAMVSNAEKTFDMTLNGDISWASINMGPIKDVTMGLAFTGLGFDYSSVSGLNFAPGTWALASPQKFMHNFPVTIQNIQFTPQSPDPGQLLKGKLGFNTVFNLTQDIGGQTSMGVNFAIEDDTPNFKKFSPKYVGMSLDSIMVNANLAAVNINGLLYIDSDHPVYGNRVGGELSAEFKGPGLNIMADAQFGNTNYLNSGQVYRYWQVNAQADFSAPGIVFLPGIAFRGFGGGAYYNMEVAVSQTGERSFTPLNNMLGFNAGATIATSPDEKGFNADVTLMGEFNTNGGGMTYVGFNGDFGTGASIMKRRNNEGNIFGNLLVEYVFPTKNFTFAANANIDTDPVKTIPGEPFNLVFNIDGMANEWSFKAGVPTSTNTVDVIGLQLYEYVMFGNAIPFPNGFTNKFTSKYVQHFGYNPNNAHMSGQIDGDLTATASGFALGLGLQFDKSGSKNVYSGAMRDWSIDWDLGAGAEMHLSFLEYASCGNYSDFGINSWRAGGGFGFYAVVGAKALGVCRNPNSPLCNQNFDVNIATLKAGGYIQGKFPKPVYATGAIDGQANVLDVFDINFHQSFEYGTNCSGSPSQPNVTLVQEDVADEFADDLVRYVVPHTGVNYAEDVPLSVQYGLAPDEEFSVPEQQASGTIEMRTFKLQKTVTLEKSLGAGNWETKGISNQINNLGEYQYYIPPPMGTISGINPGLGFNTGGNIGSSGGQSGGQQPATGLNQLGPAPAQMWNPGVQSGGNPTQYQNVAIITSPSGGGGGSNPPNYGNLPPSPPPPTNNLEEDTPYRFTVNAVLLEKINGSWVTAQNYSGDPITQTRIKSFTTGDIQPVLQHNVTY